MLQVGEKFGEKVRKYAREIFREKFKEIVIWYAGEEFAYEVWSRVGGEGVISGEDCGVRIKVMEEFGKIFGGYFGVIVVGYA